MTETLAATDDTSQVRAWLRLCRVPVCWGLLCLGAGSVWAADAPSFDCVIEPSEVVDLSTGVPGVLDRLTVDRADRIERGQLLAQLESGVELASLKLARHRVARTTDIELSKVRSAFSRRQQSRSRELFSDSAVSEQELDKLETDAVIGELELRQANDDQARALLELQRAEQTLVRRQIHAPFDGVVVERFKAVGEFVDETAVLRVARLDPLHVDAFLPVAHLANLEPGLQAEVRPESLDEVYSAWIDRVDAVADAATGTFGLRLVIPNPGQKITAGLRCTLRLLADQPRLSAADMQRRLDPGNPGLAPADTGNGSAVAAATQPAAAPDGPARALHASLSPPSPAICLRSAPPVPLERARELRERLEAEGLSAQLEEVREDRVKGYSLVSRDRYDHQQRKALSQAFVAAGFTDFGVVSERAQHSRFRLGYFGKRRFAERRAELLASLGVAVKLTAHTAPKFRYRVTWQQPQGRETVDPGARIRVEPCVVGTGS